MLLKGQIEMLKAAVAHGNGRLDLILDGALTMEDFDTADYIVNNMFEHLSAEKQTALIRDGVVKQH